MRNIIRFYNQNRLAFWIIVAIIVFGLIILHVLNGFAIENSKKKNEANQNLEEVSSYEQKQEQKKSQPIISGDNLTDEKKEQNAKILDNFLAFCANGNIEQAYNLISSDCKEVCFPTLEIFENTYCKSKFTSNKKYDYELWNSSGYNVYRIKIYEDILSTGNALNSKYIEDYYTIINENNQKKLNINGYIDRKTIDKSATKDNLTISIDYVDIYKENYIYTISLKNNSNKNIVLDTRNNSNSTYVLNSYNVKFAALLYENLEEDLTIKPNEEKTIQIKFSISYRDNMKVQSITFSDVVFNESNMNEKTKIEVEL